MINPAWPSSGGGARRYNRAWPPVDLLTAAAWLEREGHEPKVMDARARPISPTELTGRASQADLVVFQTSPLDRWQCPELNWRALAEMTAGLPKDRLVLAGAHGGMRPEEILKLTGARGLVRGEPEAAVVDLARNGGRPEGIPGFSYLVDGRVRREPERKLSKLDDFPVPAYHHLDPDDYGYEVLGPKTALLETARGCPYHCTFCYKDMYGPGVRTRSLDRVLADVRAVLDWGAESVYFIDLEFTLNRERTLRLCRSLVEMGRPFRWCCQTRADAVEPELLLTMKKAGCTLIHFGVESGSAEVLGQTRKNLEMGHYVRAVDWCREIGLKTACFFMFGLPGEQARERRMTMALARKLNPTYAGFHVAAPYPGTALNSLCQDSDPFPLCLGGPDRLRRLVRETRLAHLKFYLRPAYLWARFREEGLAGGLGLLRLFREALK